VAQGTGEDTEEIESTAMAGEQRPEASEALIAALDSAIDQCITGTGLPEIYARLANGEYEQLMKVGGKSEAAGEAQKALTQYAQAYEISLTAEQTQSAIKAMGRLTQKASETPVPDGAKDLMAKGAARRQDGERGARNSAPRLNTWSGPSPLLRGGLQGTSIRAWLKHRRGSGHRRPSTLSSTRR